MRALVLVLVTAALGCGGRSRLPLPLPPATLAATPEDAFLSPPDPHPTTDAPGLPAIETRDLPNGMRVVYVARADLPMVAVRFACRASGTEDRDLRPGVDALLQRVLRQLGHLRSPSLRGSAEPYVSVTALGAEISAEGAAGSTGAMIDTIASMVRAPGYVQEVLAPLRHELLETIAGSSRGSWYMLGVHEREMIYGASDPRAQPWWGTAPEFGRIHPEHLAARHAQLFTPGQSVLVVVGDVPIDDVERMATGAFADWSAPDAHTTPLGPAAFPVPHARLHAIPAGGDEATMHLREHAPTRSDADRPAFEILTALLGGMFSARVNHVLREERGHTYGIQAGVIDYRNYSALEIDFAVPGMHMRSSIDLLIAELERMQHADRIEGTELETARASAIGGYRNRFASRSSTARTLSWLFLRGETLEGLMDRARAIETVTADDVARVAQRWVRPEAAPILVLGPYRELMGNIANVPGGSEFVVWRW